MASSPGRARSPSASAPASWRLSPLGNLFAGDPLFGGDRDGYDHGQDDGARYANDASDDADYVDDASDYDSGGFDGGGLSTARTSRRAGQAWDQGAAAAATNTWQRPGGAAVLTVV